MERKKITVTTLGFGNVGRQVANNLVNDSNYRLAINIMDPDPQSLGAYVDLCHASQVNNLHDLFFNDVDLLEQSDYIFHCAGESVSESGERLEVAQENIEMTKNLFINTSLKKSAKIIVITNPVDVISYYSWKYSSSKAEHVIGVGTYLDSIRMNYYVQEELNDYSLNVSSVFLGEHGSSIVFAESLSTINNRPFHKEMTEVQLNKCIQRTISAAQRIKETQAATIYGVAACAVDIFRKMASNSEAVMPLSVVLSEQNQARFSCKKLAMSVMCTLVERGALQHEKMKLTSQELDLLANSAEVLSQVVDSYGGELK